MITITQDNIKELFTPAGGMNYHTADVLSIWPLATGWKERLIGRRVSDKKWHEAVAAAKKGPIHRFNGNTRRCRV